jgi:predicted dehydrogenase
VETTYIFEDDLAVRAGANMILPSGCGFEARYMAAFERGALHYSSAEGRGLLEVSEEGPTRPEVPEGHGYRDEIAYFLQCIEEAEPPERALPESSAFSVKLVEAERQSIESGRSVAL